MSSRHVYICDSCSAESEPIIDVIRHPENWFSLKIIRGRGQESKSIYFDACSLNCATDLIYKNQDVSLREIHQMNYGPPK